jgi:hypothetical protein
MENSLYFEKEINFIQSEDLRMFTKTYLDNVVPQYFFEVGASSSGKFHPKFSQGLGGLVRHTKAVSLVAEELLRMSPYSYLSDENKDFVRVACIVHDTAKYGIVEFDKNDYNAHAENASKAVADLWVEYFREPCPYLLVNAIASHMGQWGKPKMMTSVDRCVHQADYIASRNFFDIPQITEEWQTAHEKVAGEN